MRLHSILKEPLHHLAPAIAMLFPRSGPRSSLPTLFSMPLPGTSTHPMIWNCDCIFYSHAGAAMSCFTYAQALGPGTSVHS
jgi:hypothetical protein